MAYAVRKNEFNDGTVLVESDFEGEFDNIYNTLNGTNAVDIAVNGNIKLADVNGHILDANGNILIGNGGVASAVNSIMITNATAGNAPEVRAIGSDSNVSIFLRPKGGGRIMTNANLISFGTNYRSGVGFTSFTWSGSPVSLVSYNSNNTDPDGFLLLMVYSASSTGARHSLYAVCINPDGSLSSAALISGDSHTFDTSGGYLRLTSGYGTGWNYNVFILRLDK